MSLAVRLDEREIFGDPLGDVGVDQLCGHANGIGDAFGARTAMAFDDHAVEAEENRAIVIVGVKVMAHQLGCRARDEEAELGPNGACKGAAQQVRHEAGGALHRLQRDVAGKAIAHDDVGQAAGDLVAFNEAVKVHVQMVCGAQGGGQCYCCP